MALPSVASQEQLGGLGRVTEAVLVDTQVRLTEAGGGKVTFHGQYAAVIEPEALSISVLARDVLGLLALVIDRPGNLSCRLRPGVLRRMTPGSLEKRLPRGTLTMRTELPDWLVERITANPLPRRERMEQVLAGDLDQGAQSYARQATNHGAAGDWWQIWRDIQDLRNKPLTEALDELTPEGRRWYAKWAFANGRKDEGLAAYATYLANPGRFGPFSDETVVYLDHLLQDARHPDVLEIVDALAVRYDDLPLEQMCAARALAALGKHREAIGRVRSARERHPDAGSLWALEAILLHQTGDTAAAQTALGECLRLPLEDPRLLQELREVLGPMAGGPEEGVAGTAAHGSAATPRPWAENPGWRPVPSDRPTPHHYGGETFRMPACAGCGHPIRQWFVFDLREIPVLRERLPAWALFPLLGCADCTVHMGRHDYEVDLETLEVRLVNVGISVTRFGKACDTLPPIPQQFVGLEDGTGEDDGWEHPQIGGVPNWTQQPERVFCRGCRSEMVFVGAMASTIGFEPYVPINNESGFQYHFGCGNCRTISVIAQWS